LIPREVRVEDDGSSSATMTKSLRKRTTVAHSKAGVEVAACSRAGIEDSRWWKRHGGF
jgi:hypothetical protein